MKMIYTTTTDNIKVSVENYYQSDYSNPLNHEFLFAYRVTIENNSNETIRLLKRKWKIFDSCGEFKEVVGIGVVGKQPLIKSGETYQYMSGCALKSEIGWQKGEYLMRSEDTGRQFIVYIPEFHLFVPFKLN